MNEMLTVEGLGMITPPPMVHVLLALLDEAPMTKREIREKANLSRTMADEGTRWLDGWGIADCDWRVTGEKQYWLVDDWHLQMQYGHWWTASHMEQYKRHVSSDFANVVPVTKEELIAGLRGVAEGIREWLRPKQRQP